MRCIPWTPDNGVRGRRWAFRTRTRGRVICADGWKFTAARSMFFFPARVAAEKFRRHRSIAAPATIPGPSVKGWLRSSVRAGISSTVCWPDQARERLSLRFSLEQHGRAATSTFGFSPARTGTRGFFKMIWHAHSNVQRLGKHAGSGAFSLRIRLAGADQLSGRHNPPRQRAGSGNFRSRSFAGERSGGFSRHGGSVVDRGQLRPGGERSVAFADQESMKRLLLQLFAISSCCAAGGRRLWRLASAIRRHCAHSAS